MYMKCGIIKFGDLFLQKPIDLCHVDNIFPENWMLFGDASVAHSTLISGLPFFSLCLVPFCVPLHSVKVWSQTIPHTWNAIERHLGVPQVMKVSAKTCWILFLKLTF